MNAFSSLDAPALTQEIVTLGGVSKSTLSRHSGVSRPLLDDYLKGRKQPSISQLSRLAEAAGVGATIRLEPPPRSVPRAFVEVLEFGELFARPANEAPIPDLSAVWRRHG